MIFKLFFVIQGIRYIQSHPYVAHKNPYLSHIDSHSLPSVNMVNHFFMFNLTPYSALFHAKQQLSDRVIHKPS